MRLNPRRPRRRGATLAESAMVTTAFIILLVGMLDLGMFVFRYNAVNQAARQGVRQAIVHGSLATSGWNGGPWGPSTYGPVTASAAQSDPKVQAIVPSLSGIDLSTVQVTYEWTGTGGTLNAAEQPVRVTVSTTWTPFLTSIFGASGKTVSAAATMLIAH